MRWQAGIDVLAWLAIALAVVLDEMLAAAVIALMLASGRTLEARHARDACTSRTGVFVMRATRPATVPTSQPVTPRRP